MAHGRTAVITGASSGIGAEYARQLARRGWNMVLVARRVERLEQLAAELARAHGIVAHAWQFDLAEPCAVAAVAQRLAATPGVAMLINNAGFDSNALFAESAARDEAAMFQIHVAAALALTRAVLPAMLAAQHGAIINVASLAALVPTAGHAAYGASKAALVNFSEALQMELAGSGVRVQALCPGLTRSEFHDTAAFSDFDRAYFPAPFWMSAEAVVAQSLHDLQRGWVVCVPGRANRMLARLGQLGFAPFLWRALEAYPRRKRGSSQLYERLRRR